MKKFISIILSVLVLFNTISICPYFIYAQELNNSVDEESTKVLTLTVTDNVPLGKKYPLELVIEPRDKDGNILGKPGEFNRLVIVPKNLSATVRIDNLPPKTVEVKAILNRGQAFLEMIQERINNEGWNVNILNDPRYKQAQVSVIKLSGTTITYCEIDPESAKIGGNAVFAYGLKSAKANNITAFGIRTQGSNQLIPINNIKQIVNLEKRLGGAKSGNIDFTVPNEWSNYNSVVFNLISADERDECVLKIVNDDMAFEIGDDNEKLATYNGKTIKVKELKQLLFDLGLITQTDLDQPTYTNEVNQAYWKLTCAIDEAKRSTLDPNLRLQTAENPLKCTVAHFEGYPDIKYIEDVSVWIEFINGLKVRVGNDISAYVNPNTIRIIALFIALTTFLSPPTWVIFVAGFALAGVDIKVRIDEVNKLWSDTSNANYNQTNGWKIGYSVGTLLTAVPGLIPANAVKGIKAAESASKLDDYSHIQDLITSEQRTINWLSGLEPTGDRQAVLNNFVTSLKDVPSKVNDYDLSGLSLLDKTIGELKPSGNKYKLLELFTKDTPEVRNTTILKNILIDEVQAEAVTRTSKPLAKDLAKAIVQSVDNAEYKPLSTYFHGKGYEKISKVIPRDSVPQYQSRCVTPDTFKKYHLPDTEEFRDLRPEQIIEQINNSQITKDKLIGTVSSSSMANFVTPTEPIQSLTATQINGPEGLGLGIPSSDFKGLVEIQIDTSKLPSNVEFRLPISVLGNQYFKPTKLNSNSGVTIGNYLEWIVDEFSALSQDGIIAKIKGLPKNE